MDALQYPATLVGFLGGGWLGWMVGGQIGAILGAVAGLFAGLYMDVGAGGSRATPSTWSPWIGFALFCAVAASQFWR